MRSYFLMKEGKPTCNSNANDKPCSPIKVDITLTSTWKWKGSRALGAGWFNNYQCQCKIHVHKNWMLLCWLFWSNKYILGKEILTNMYSWNSSHKRISMKERFLHGTKQRFNSIILVRTSKTRKSRIYREEFVQGYYSQDSCRPKFYDFLPHNSHRAEPNFHALFLRSR